MDKKKRSLERLISLLHFALPTPNNFPKNKYHFLKLLFSLLPQHTDLIKKYQICEDCMHYIGVLNKNNRVPSCEACHGSNVNGCFVEYNLRQIIKDSFETRNLRELIDEHQKEKVDENFICDFT